MNQFLALLTLLITLAFAKGPKLTTTVEFTIKQGSDEFGKINDYPISDHS